MGKAKQYLERNKEQIEAVYESAVDESTKEFAEKFRLTKLLKAMFSAGGVSLFLDRC